MPGKEAARKGRKGHPEGASVILIGVKPNFLLPIQKTKTIADEKWLGYWNDVCSALGLPQKDRPSRRWFISQYHFHPEDRAKWDYTNKALANLSMPMKIERRAPLVLELGLCGRKKRTFVTAERYMCIFGAKGCKAVSLKNKISSQF